MNKRALPAVHCYVNPEEGLPLLSKQPQFSGVVNFTKHPSELLFISARSSAADSLHSEGALHPVTGEVTAVQVTAEE